jgi:sulfur-carrier protein
MRSTNEAPWFSPSHVKRVEMKNNIAIVVDFYTTLQGVFGTKSMRIDIGTPATVSQILDAICQTDRQRERIQDPSGQLRRDIKIFRNGRDIIFLNNLDTEVHNGDKIAIFPPVAGG